MYSGPEQYGKPSIPIHFKPVETFVSKNVEEIRLDKSLVHFRRMISEPSLDNARRSCIRRTEPQVLAQPPPAAQRFQSFPTHSGILLHDFSLIMLIVSKPATEHSEHWMHEDKIHKLQVRSFPIRTVSSYNHLTISCTYSDHLDLIKFRTIWDRRQQNADYAQLA